MKDQFLKMAGVKTEAAFYKKYKTEKDFFKAHPKAKKMTKAQVGIELVSSYANQLQNIPNMQNVIQEQMQTYGVNANIFNGPQVDNSVSTITSSQLADNKSGYAFSGGPNTNVEKTNNFVDQLSKMAGPASQIIGGIQSIKEGKRKRKEAEKWAKVTDVQARAAESEDIDDFRQYTENMNKKRRAFMPVNTGEEFFPIYGVGTNVLAKNGAKLEDGGMIEGNPTEIQNTYAPEYDIYSDLEYTPLYNVNQTKSYQTGGEIPWEAIGGLGNQGAASLTGNDGGGQVGGTIGGVAGMAIGGPAGQAIGQIAGTAIGGLLDTNDRDQRKAEAKTKANINRMLTSQMREANKQMFGSYMEDGGYVSNDWNPQVITKFGNLDEQEFAKFAHKDEFRAGGHLKSYTPPSERAMQTFAMGGELETHWGGYAEPMSYNPYLPDGGETVMFRGKSHEEYSPNGETGIGITYGNNPVEVERGEPAVKLKDGGTGEDNLTVYGNLMIPKYGVDLLEDKNAKGKKFKNYVADLSKVEEKQNKIIDKSTNQLDALDIRSSFDKLKFNALEANIKGGNLKLKEIADKKVKAADLQNAINETAEEYGLIADDLARGKVKTDKEAMKAQAKYGAAIKKAQYGLEVWEGNKTGLGKKTASEFTLDQWNQIAKKYGFKGQGNLEFQKFLMSNPETSKIIKARHNMLYGKNPETDPNLYDAKLGRGYAAAELLDLPPAAEVPKDTKPKGDQTKKEDAKFETVPYKRSGLIDAFGQLLPYIRPTDQEELDPTQLTGEMFALSTNKLEPVQAQPYSPKLRVPYDISRQAAKNDLIAQTRAAQRMAQGNPAVQAMIAAQAYSPMQQLNEQDFIDNQRMKDAVYSGNIATLNDAELKNLAIYDQQYERQEAAKSNTKATAQAALNSISDKYAKNRLENRTLGVYENLYNYRYDNAGRAINMNAPFQANIPYIYGNDGKPTHKIVYDKTGKNIIGYTPITEEEEVKTIPSLATAPFNQQSDVAIADNKDYVPYISTQEKNGGKVNKKYSQSSIVRAFK